MRREYGIYKNSIVLMVERVRKSAPTTIIMMVGSRFSTIIMMVVGLF